VLSVLDAARDESNKDAAVRLVFEPKTSRIGQQELITTLLAHTSLETSVAHQPDHDWPWTEGLRKNRQANVAGVDILPANDH